MKCPDCGSKNISREMVSMGGILTYKHVCQNCHEIVEPDFKEFKEMQKKLL